MKKKKAETKNGPVPIDDEAPGRVTMETIVTEPEPGLKRMVALMRRLLPPKAAAGQDRAP